MSAFRLICVSLISSCAQSCDKDVHVWGKDLSWLIYEVVIETVCAITMGVVHWSQITPYLNSIVYPELQAIEHSTLSDLRCLWTDTTVSSKITCCDIGSKSFYLWLMVVSLGEMPYGTVPYATSEVVWSGRWRESANPANSTLHSSDSGD